MTPPTPEPLSELERALSDRDWWREFCALCGGVLIGFNYRDAATVASPDGRTTTEVPGWLAEPILATAKAALSARDAGETR